MSFANIHEVLRAGAGSLTPAVFAGQDLQRLIGEALDESDAWHRRHCALQAPIVVSAVVAMSLYRSLSIVNVFKRVLDLARGDRDVSLTGITPEAFYHARERLGSEPLRLLAVGLAQQANPSASFFGLVPCAMDGVSMVIPDTPENEAAFGRPPASRGETAFPQMKGVGLVYTDTHVFRNCVWGRWNLSELSAAEILLGSLGSQDVVFLDRRYTKIDLWFQFLDRRVHFVHRLSATYKAIPVVTLGKGDSLINVGRWVAIPEDERKDGRTRRWESRQLRLIQYQIGENEQVSLITDLIDPLEYPARDLAVGYHIRWEIELSNDETKTHLSTVGHGTQHTTFRSKTPAGIYQEAWGLVAAYNLIRCLMVEAGKAHNVPPLHISFVETVEIIRMAWPQLQSTASASKRKALYLRMLHDIADCRLDRPRRKRAAPRVVKVKISKFPVKRKGHRSRRRDFEADLKLVDTPAAVLT